MKILLLPFAFAAMIVGIVLFACMIGLAGAFTGVVVGLGVGLGGAVIGVTVGLFKLLSHMGGPILIVLGILLLVKIADRV